MERKPRYRLIKKRGEPLTLEHIRENCVETERGCWEWQRFCEPGGYGLVWFDGRTCSAHASAFLLSGGVIPPNNVVRHSCDNRRCCNPEHLSVGTQKQNMEDMIDRDRVARGADHGRATITPETALGIWQASGTHREIAAQFGVTQAIVQAIKCRRTWRHVTEGIARADERPNVRPVSPELYVKAARYLPGLLSSIN